MRFFEGREGISILIDEVLKGAKEVWYLSSISDWAKHIPEYANLVEKQIDKGIKIRDLVRPSKEALEYQKYYKKASRKCVFCRKAPILIPII